MKRRALWIWLLAPATVLGATAACSDDDDDAGPVVRVEEGSTQPGAVQSEAQAVTVLRAINDGEVEQANATSSRLTDARARAYAARMLAEHTAANGRLDALTGALALAPAPSTTSQDLVEDSRAVVQQLAALEGAELDRAYMRAQVDGHALALTLIDQTLVPVASSSALQAELQTARQAVSGHLDEARALVTSLSADGGAPSDGGG